MIRSLIHFELYLFLCIYEEEDECSLCCCPFVFVEVDLGLIFPGGIFFMFKIYVNLVSQEFSFVFFFFFFFIFFIFFEWRET